MSKYHSQKIVRDGETWDSKAEYKRWCDLRLMQRKGMIHNLERQVSFELIPAQYESYPRYSDKDGRRLKDGRRCVERAVTYRADFVYQQGGKTIVEDCKGMRTDEYIIKRKLMLWRHGIRIKET